MKDLELLYNSTDYCLTTNYCVIVLIIMYTLIIINKTSRFINKINISLDKYFKRKYLKNEKSFKISCYVTQLTLKKNYIKKSYIICY
jgi:hypothetical protein